MRVRPIEKSEEVRYRELMAQHHYLGDLAKIGHTLWYVATCSAQWAALLSFSAAAWKCGVRDRWIGWDVRQQYARLGLLANNGRFLILPDWHSPNLGSKVLSLCQERILADWQDRSASDSSCSRPLSILRASRVRSTGPLTGRA